jgi:cephalosporin hydroxylase
VWIAGALSALSLAQLASRTATSEPAPPVDPAERFEITGRFLALWNSSPIGVAADSWLGVPTLLNPADAWITQEILFDVKPDFVVETGAAAGGSAALWATLLGHYNPRARVIAIAASADATARARELQSVRERVDFLVGEPTDAAIVAEVRRRVAGGKVLVIVDPAPSREQMAAKLAAYAELVGAGSYLIARGTGQASGRPSQAPESGAAAVRDFLARHGDFSIDAARERLIVTSSPHGYLARRR